MILFLPSDFEINTFISFLYENGFPANKLDNCLFFFHLIIITIKANKIRKLKDPYVDDQYAYLHNTILIKLLGRDYYQDYLTLLKTKYIDANRKFECSINGDVRIIVSYQPGVKSKGFKIKNFKGYRYQQYHNQEMINLYYQAKNNLYKSRAHYDYVKKNVEELVLIETEESKKEISNWLFNTKRIITAEDYIYLWSNNDLQFPIRCKFGNRLHSKLTSTKKALRKFIRFRSDVQSGDLDKDLIDVDFKNSQLYFYSILTPNLISNLLPNLSSVIPILNKYQGFSDINKFNVLCQKGVIYEYFRWVFNKKYNLRLNRDDCKKACFVSIFSNYKDKSRRLSGEKISLDKKDIPYTDSLGKRIYTQKFSDFAWQVFTAEFPNLAEMFKEIQQLKWSNLSGGTINPSEDFTNTSLLAQRLESKVVFDHIIPKLEAQELKVCTIHDSFLIYNNQNDIDKVKNAIYQSFKDLGVTPPSLH